MTREVIWRWVTPRWRKHLDALVRDERPDALVVFTVPMAHLRGIPSYLRERYGLPIVFYDGDVPMSLPEFGGMDTGFNWYHQADPSEYDLVVSNSEGGLERLRELGARRAEAVFWGADPDFFAPHEVEKQMDVFFYGYGDKFRRDWMQALVGEPSRALPDVDFALGGRDFQGDVGTARMIGDVPFNAFAGRSPQRVSTSASRAAHTQPSTRRPRADRSSSPPPARRSSRTPTTASSAGSSPAPELVIVENDAARRSPPIAICSPIRLRRRRWAVVRASACSTSTPTATARGGCSS